MKIMILTAIAMFGLSAQAQSTPPKVTCGGRIIDKVSANGFDRFPMVEDGPGHLVFRRVTDGLEYKAEVRYDTAEQNPEIRLQVSIGAKAAIAVQRLTKDQVGNVMLMNDLNALTQAGRVDPRFIDIDCVRL